MPPPKPSDRTTHPTPQTTRHSHAPRPAPVITGAYLRSIDPLDARPAVWPEDPPLSREYRPHDGLYYPFTQATPLSSSIQTAPEITYIPTFHPHPRPSRREHYITRPFSFRRNSNRNTLRLLSPLTPATPNNMTNQMAPALPPRNTARPTPRFTAGRTAKPAAEKKPASTAAPLTASSIGWVHNLRKKRRPSEIFNMNFSFAAKSQRGQADRTPPISPRSSFSSGSDSASLTEESFKRQRVDSSGSEAVVGFPFGKPTPVTSTRGRDLGSSSIPPCESSNVAAVTASPRPQPIVVPAREPHPGRLVDFASPDYDIPAPLPSPLSEYKLRLSTEAYEDYMASTTRRRSSFPIVGKAMRRVRQESKMLATLEKLDTEAGAVHKSNATAPEKTDESKGHQYTQSSSSTSSSMSWVPATPTTPMTTSFTQGAVVLQRTTSDPSTEAFLAHVRASLKARESAAVMRWHDYPVFADEPEKGFLDPMPL